MDRNMQMLLFDIDGTLLDFNAAEEMGLRRVLAALCPDRLEEMIMVYRRINHGLWSAYETGTITKSQITDTRFSLLFQEFHIDENGIETEDRYRELLNHSAILVDGAIEILEYLKNKVELYVVTNGFLETQTMRMADSGLSAYFIKSFISEEVGYQKPQKEFFDYCFDHVGPIKKDEVMIIGDSLQSDIKGGNVAGIQTCWYNPNCLPRENSIVVNREIRKLSDLKSFL